MHLVEKLKVCMKYLTAQMHIAQSNSFFKIGNLAQIVILSGFPGNEANCSYVAGIKFVDIVKVLVLTMTLSYNLDFQGEESSTGPKVQSKK